MKHLTSRSVALFLCLCLSFPGSVYALREPSTAEKDPQTLTGLEEALKNPQKALRQLAQLLATPEPPNTPSPKKLADGRGIQLPAAGLEEQPSLDPFDQQLAARMQQNTVLSVKELTEMAASLEKTEGELWAAMRKLGQTIDPKNKNRYTFFRVLDEKGKETDQLKTRMAIHQDGDWHAGSALLAGNARRAVLQLRKKREGEKKEKLNLTAAGHTEVGHTSLETMSLESEEEARLSPSPSRILEIPNPLSKDGLFRKIGQQNYSKGDGYDSGGIYRYEEKTGLLKNSEVNAFYIYYMSDDEIDKLVKEFKPTEEVAGLVVKTWEELKRDLLIDKKLEDYADSIHQYLTNPEVFKHIRDRFAVLLKERASQFSGQVEELRRSLDANPSQPELIEQLKDWLEDQSDLSRQVVAARVLLEQMQVDLADPAYYWDPQNPYQPPNPEDRGRLGAERREAIDTRVQALKILKDNVQLLPPVQQEPLPGYIDLQVHTFMSDGSKSPSAVVFEAWRRGMKAIGINDHNTFDHFEEAIRAGNILGITVIPSIEVDFVVPELGLTKANGHALVYFPVKDLDQWNVIRQKLEEKGLPERFEWRFKWNLMKQRKIIDQFNATYGHRVLVSPEVEKYRMGGHANYAFVVGALYQRYDDEKLKAMLNGLDLPDGSKLVWENKEKTSARQVANQLIQNHSTVRVNFQDAIFSGEVQAGRMEEHDGNRWFGVDWKDLKELQKLGGVLVLPHPNEEIRFWLPYTGKETWLSDEERKEYVRRGYIQEKERRGKKEVKIWLAPKLLQLIGFDGIELSGKHGESNAQEIRVLLEFVGIKPEEFLVTVGSDTHYNEFDEMGGYRLGLGRLTHPWARAFFYPLYSLQRSWVEQELKAAGLNPYEGIPSRISAMSFWLLPGEGKSVSDWRVGNLKIGGVTTLTLEQGMGMMGIGKAQGSLLTVDPGLLRLTLAYNPEVTTDEWAREGHTAQLPKLQIRQQSPRSRTLQEILEDPTPWLGQPFPDLPVFAMDALQVGFWNEDPEYFLIIDGKAIHRQDADRDKVSWVFVLEPGLPRLEQLSISQEEVKEIRLGISGPALLYQGEDLSNAPDRRGALLWMPAETAAAFSVLGRDKGNRLLMATFAGDPTQQPEVTLRAVSQTMANLGAVDLILLGGSMDAQMMVEAGGKRHWLLGRHRSPPHEAERPLNAVLLGFTPTPRLAPDQLIHGWETFSHEGRALLTLELQRSLVQSGLDPRLDSQALQRFVAYALDPLQPPDTFHQIVSDILGKPIDGVRQEIQGLDLQAYQPSENVRHIGLSAPLKWDKDRVRKLLEDTVIVIAAGGAGARFKGSLPEPVRDQLDRLGRLEKPSVLVGPSGTSPVVQALEEISELARRVGASEAQVIVVTNTNSSEVVQKDIDQSRSRLAPQLEVVYPIEAPSFPSFDPVSKKILTVEDPQTGRRKLLTNPNGTYGAFRAAYEKAEEEKLVEGKAWLVLYGDDPILNTSEFIARVLSGGSDLDVAPVAIKKEARNDPVGGTLVDIVLSDSQRLHLIIEKVEREPDPSKGIPGLPAFNQAEDDASARGGDPFGFNTGVLWLSSKAAEAAARLTPRIRHAVRKETIDGNERDVLKMELFLTHVPAMIGNLPNMKFGVLQVDPEQYGAVKDLAALVKATRKRDEFSRMLLAQLPGGNQVTVESGIYLDIRPGFQGFEGQGTLVLSDKEGSMGAVFGVDGLTLVPIVQLVPIGAEKHPIFADPGQGRQVLHAKAGKITLTGSQTFTARYQRAVDEAKRLSKDLSGNLAQRVRWDQDPEVRELLLRWLEALKASAEQGAMTPQQKAGFPNWESQLVVRGKETLDLLSEGLEPEGWIRKEYPPQVGISLVVLAQRIAGRNRGDIPLLKRAVEVVQLAPRTEATSDAIAKTTDRIHWSLKEEVDLSSLSSAVVYPEGKVGDLSQAKTVLITADAGYGKRWADSGGILPKVVAEVAGFPAGWRTKQAAEELGWPVISIVSYEKELVKAVFDLYTKNGIIYVEAERPNGGTGYAFYHGGAVAGLRNSDALVIASAGDQPLYDGEVLEAAQRKFLEGQRLEKKVDLVIATALFDNAKGKGRIVRDREEGILGILEQADIDKIREGGASIPEPYRNAGYRDADALEAIQEGNISIYAMPAKPFFDLLEGTTNGNAQRQFYVTDIVQRVIGQGKRVEAVRIPQEKAPALTTVADLAKAERFITEHGLPRGPWIGPVEWSGFWAKVGESSPALQRYLISQGISLPAGLEEGMPADLDRLASLPQSGLEEAVRVLDPAEAASLYGADRVNGRPIRAGVLARLGADREPAELESPGVIFADDQVKASVELGDLPVIPAGSRWAEMASQALPGAGPHDLLLVESEEGLTGEMVEMALRNRFPTGALPQAVMGRLAEYQALGGQAAAVIQAVWVARRRNPEMPPVVQIGVVLRLQTESGNAYQLILMT